MSREQNNLRKKIRGEEEHAGSYDGRGMVRSESSRPLPRLPELEELELENSRR
jgi:hypothetical protein